MGLIAEHIAGFASSALSDLAESAPWELTFGSVAIVERLLGRLDDGYSLSGNVAVHHSTIVEAGAVLKGPAIIGPGCFIAAGAYLRGGCWLERNCVLGPGAELKSSFLFAGSRLAHFNFVGDSVIGAEVNLEAGAIIANYRSDPPGRLISFTYRGKLIETGAERFGALVGDGCKVGANAVIAPGAILGPAIIVERLSLVDQGVK
jgi:NDP-sugar pyrophosphorylase family protein